MSIPQKAFYHGAALFEITQDGHFSSINKMPNISSSSAYLLNHNIGVYIKHTTVEKEPKCWKFTFAPEHQEVIRKMYDLYREKTYVAFVCQDEGICVVDFSTLTSSVDFNYSDSEWCEIYRPDGGSFRIIGKKGEYPKTIALNAFPAVLFD